MAGLDLLTGFLHEVGLPKCCQPVLPCYLLCSRGTKQNQSLFYYDSNNRYGTGTLAGTLLSDQSQQLSTVRYLRYPYLPNFAEGYQYLPIYFVTSAIEFYAALLGFLVFLHDNGIFLKKIF